jgi:hypothetical protein|tara:strand:+ start:177 stop:512 length:336 start_codon:yes stop_codon:yes gene_type:complete
VILDYQIELLVKHLAGDYGWMLLIAFAALTFKNIITRLVEGIMFFIGSDYQLDDVVYIDGTKKVRITRQGITKTTFYVYDTKRKLIIRNDKLPHLMLEKSLPQNGDSHEDH